MSHQWLFNSETYDNCNCAINCGCHFNLPSTHGNGQSAFIGNVVDGRFNCLHHFDQISQRCLGLTLYCSLFRFDDLYCNTDGS